MKKFQILTTILLSIALIFIARLAYLQIFSDRYLLNGFNTSVKQEFEIPQRGFILDRNGKILVTNSPSYEIVVTEELMSDPFDTLTFCRLIEIPVSEFKERMNSLHSQPTFNPSKPAVFMKNVTEDEATTYAERMYRYKAFKIQDNSDRRYLTQFGGNILGYINEVSPRDIALDSTYYTNGDKIGKAGVEKSYEAILRGKKGIKWVEKDIHQKSIGSYQNGKYDQEMEAGSDIKITIDFELQELAEHMLQNKRGAIVALDPNTGEILCLASAPSYSPLEISGFSKQENLYRLLNDSFQKPMYDRALQAAYPPGSTFKMLTGLAAMQMGVIDTGTVFYCRHGFRLGNRWVKCHDAGPQRIESAIQYSCNTYFSRTYAAIIGKDSTDYNKGLEEWVDIMHSFGLGEYFGNDLPVGNKGNIPNTAYYDHAFGEGHVQPYSVFSNGIGQGEVLLTPLQMANMTAAIANEGFYYTPHIVKEINGEAIHDKQFTEPKMTKVDPKYFKYIKNGMKRVVLGGTARRIRTRIFTQMGKTGTAQNPHKDHSLFVLAAPVDNPQIVVAAVVENAGAGATFAAPMASVIAEKYVTGKVERQYIVKSMAQRSLQYEYRRQWVNYLKKKGKWIDYVDPQQLDSMNLDPVNIAMIKEAIRQKKIEEMRRKIKDSLEQLKKRRKRRNFHSMRRNAIANIDYTVLILFLLIVSFGILNVSSVAPEFGSKQLMFLGIAIVVGCFFFLIQSILFESTAFLLYIFGILLLVGVLIIGKEINGAKAWYVFGPVSLQPIELVKIFTALTLAAVVNSTQFDIKSRNSLLQLAIILGLPIILLLLQPDVGSILVFTAFFIALYREGFPGYWFILGMYAIVLVLFSITYGYIYVIAALAILAILFILVVYFFKWLKLSSGVFLALMLALLLSAGLSYSSGYLFDKLAKHQKERIMVLIEGESAYRDTSGYNLLYAKSAIAVGRLKGSGFKQGTVTKGKFVPEQRTDYIFCTVGEEWGFLGSAILVILYTAFIARIYYLSEQSKGRFLRVYGYCFGSIVLMHFVMNIGMVLGLFPTVGIPLPYFSYGGSSLLSFTIMFFIFLRLVYKDKSSLI